MEPDESVNPSQALLPPETASDSDDTGRELARGVSLTLAGFAGCAVVSWWTGLLLRPHEASLGDQAWRAIEVAAVSLLLASVLLVIPILAAGLRWRSAPLIALPALFVAVLAAYGVLMRTEGPEDPPGAQAIEALLGLSLAAGLPALALAALRAVSRAEPAVDTRRHDDCRRAARLAVAAWGASGVMMLGEIVFYHLGISNAALVHAKTDLLVHGSIHGLAGVTLLWASLFLPHKRPAQAGGASLILLAILACALRDAWSPDTHSFPRIAAFSAISLGGYVIAILVWRACIAAGLKPSLRRKFLRMPRFALLPFSPRLRVIPLFVTVNFLVFLLMLRERDYAPESSGWQSLAWGAADNKLQAEGEPERALTVAFVHSNFEHLAGNMAAALALGIPLEVAIGSGGIIALFGIHSLVDAIVGAYLDPQGSGRGASGFTSALLGALAVLALKRRFARDRRWRLFAFRWGWVIWPAVAAGLWRRVPEFVFEKDWPLAHATGFASGVVVALVLLSSRRSRKADRRQRWALVGALAAVCIAFLSVISETGLLSATRLASRMPGKLGAPFASSFVEKAKQALDAESFEEAVQLASRGLDIEATNIAGRLYRAFGYFGKGQYDLAIRDYDAILAIEPNNAYVFGRRGDANMARKDFEAAVADFRRHAELEPNNAQPWGQLARSLAEAGRPSEGLDAVEKAITLDPNEVWLRKARADLRKARRQFDLAIPDYLLFAERFPDYAAVWTDLANCRMDAAKISGDKAGFAAAAKDFERAANIDKGNHGLRYDQACALFMAHEDVHAPIVLGELLAEDPRCGNCWILLGKIRFRLGQWDAAALCLAKAAPLTFGPAAFELHYFRAIALHCAGRDKEADAAFLEAERHPSGDHCSDCAKRMRAGLYISRLIESSAPPVFASAPRRQEAPKTKSASQHKKPKPKKP